MTKTREGTDNHHSQLKKEQKQNLEMDTETQDH